MQGEIIQNISKELSREPNSLWNYRESKHNKNFRFSNLTFNTIFPNEDYIKSFLPSLFLGLKAKYKSINNLKVNDNNAKSILNCIENFLKAKFNFHKIDFVTNTDGEKLIYIYKWFDYQEYIVWFFQFENIYNIKHKAPKLYEILTSIISLFSFTTQGFNSYIDSTLDMMKDNFEDNIDDLDYFGENEKQVKYEYKGFMKMNKELKNSSSYTNELLNSYKPRKKAYQNIIAFLKEPKNINFSLIDNFKLCKSDIVQDESIVFFQDLFGVVFNNNIITKSHIINNINDVANNYGMMLPLDCMVINEEGKIIKDFSIKNNELNDLTTFIQEFNNLTNKL